MPSNALPNGKSNFMHFLYGGEIRYFNYTASSEKGGLQVKRSDDSSNSQRTDSADMLFLLL